MGRNASTRRANSFVKSVVVVVVVERFTIHDFVSEIQESIVCAIGLRSDSEISLNSSDLFIHIISEFQEPIFFYRASLGF